MKRFLALAFAGVLVAIVAGCGGGGGTPTTTTTPPPPPPPPPSQYAGVAAVMGEECAYAVGAIATRGGSPSSAQDTAYRTCESTATTAAAGAPRDRCQATSTDECVAVAVGINDSGLCTTSTVAGGTISAAQSSALQRCRTRLGSTNNCGVLVSGCAPGSPSTDVWRPSRSGDGNGGGVDRNQVGNEFGTTSTSGRNWNLSCGNNVVFSNSGNVVLPSVEVVALPSEAGTVTLDYDAYSVPDRFVVQVGGQIRIDT